MDIDSTTNNGSAWFDANGNTRTNGTSTYLYDWANRLTNADNAAIVITYDPDGNRVKKVAGGTTTLYLVSTVNPSGYAQVLEELTVSGGSNTLTCAYVYGLDLISQRRPNVTTNFYAVDGLGSTRLLLNLTGGVSAAYVFDAFGNVITNTGTTLNNYRFQGEQWDADLGLSYRRARYDSPNTGRFLTRDPHEGDHSDTLSLHKYSFAHANPVNNFDPTGFAVEYDAAKGLKVHTLFSIWCRSQGMLSHPNGTLHQYLPELFPAGARGGNEKPDCIDQDGRQYFELKPVTHIMRFAVMRWKQSKNFSNTAPN